MKPQRFLAVLLTIIALTAVPVFAADEVAPRTAGADIVRMWTAHLSPDTILLFVRQNPDVRFTADDITTMAQAGLPDRFIRDLMKAASAASRNSYAAPAVYAPYPYAYPYYYPSYYPTYWGGSIFIGGGHFGGGHFGGGHFGGGHGHH